MDTKTYGGVTAKDVIVFQTKIMMGAQFGRIVWAREHKEINLENSQNEILAACLRIGWNDAFRHTSAMRIGGRFWRGSRSCFGWFDCGRCGGAVSKRGLLSPPSFPHF